MNAVYNFSRFQNVYFGAMIVSLSTMLSTSAFAEESCPISITIEADIEASPEEIFSFAVADGNLPEIMIGYGPLPAVTSTEVLIAPFEQVGGRRQVNLSDDSTAFEEITALDPSSHFAYRVWGYTNSMASLAEEARGEWWIEPRGDATHVIWRYTFVPKGALERPFLRLIVNTFFRGYMRTGLEQIKMHLESSQVALVP